MTPPGAGAPSPRVVLAGNAGPFTLDGTRTHLVGRERVAVIDPGPDDPGHIRALVAALAGAEAVTVLLTHGHADHAAAAPFLAGELGVGIRGSGLGAVPLADGEAIVTDQGVLLAVTTPGHTADHLAFHWPAARALFAGDLLLGEGDTTWVGEYAGCVADYLGSLERLRALELEVVYPAHGPPLSDPGAALDRFTAHREARVEQVRDALRAEPGASPERLVQVLYGELPSAVGSAAKRSVEAILHHVGRPA